MGASNKDNKIWVVLVYHVDTWVALRYKCRKLTPLLCIHACRIACRQPDASTTRWCCTPTRHVKRHCTACVDFRGKVQTTQPRVPTQSWYLQRWRGWQMQHGARGAAFPTWEDSRKTQGNKILMSIGQRHLGGASSSPSSSSSSFSS